MNKKLLLSLTIAATAFLASCNKTDSSTNDSSSNGTTLVPITAFSLKSNAVEVGVGGNKYIQITGVSPMNATIIDKAFNFAYGAGAGVVAASVVDGTHLIKVSGTTAGTARTVTVTPSGATSRAFSASATITATVSAASATEPASDFTIAAGGKTAAQSLTLTVAAGGTIPFTLAAKNAATPSVAITDFATAAIIGQVSALETPGNNSTLALPTTGTAAGTAAGTVTVGTTLGSETLVIGALHNDDINVKLNLNIVAPITFNTTAIGNLTFTAAASATAPTLSTLNGAASTTNVTTGITTGTAIVANTVLQTINAAGILSLISNTPALTAVPLGAYTAAVTIKTTGTNTPTVGDIIATVGTDGSLVLAASAALPKAGATYTVTLSNTATTPVVLGTFDVVVN